MIPNVVRCYELIIMVSAQILELPSRKYRQLREKKKAIRDVHVNTLPQDMSIVHKVYIAHICSNALTNYKFVQSGQKRVLKDSFLLRVHEAKTFNCLVFLN